MPDVSEISGFQDAVSQNEDVALATSMRHEEAHAILSSDHSDVDSNAVAQTGDVIQFDGNKFRPGRLYATVALSGRVVLDAGGH